LMRALSRGAPIALMNDQKFREGLAVPLFGHDAMTAPGPTRLAMKYGVPLVPVSTERTGPARFRIVFHQPFLPEATGDEARDVEATLKRINAFMEDTIRETPGQWFWQHRRWPKEAWAKAGVM
jgi:Kdo2-lipid IVA lauroyltransferase/acyltransferase